MAETNSSPISSSSSEFDGSTIYRLNFVSSTDSSEHKFADGTTITFATTSLSNLATAITNAQWNDGNALGIWGAGSWNSANDAASMAAKLCVDSIGKTFVDVWIKQEDSAGIGDPDVAKLVAGFQLENSEGNSEGIDTTAIGTADKNGNIKVQTYWQAGMTTLEATSGMDITIPSSFTAVAAGDASDGSTSNWYNSGYTGGGYDNTKGGLAFVHNTTTSTNRVFDDFEFGDATTEDNLSDKSKWMSLAIGTGTGSLVSGKTRVFTGATPLISGNMSVQLSSGLVAVLPVSGGTLLAAANNLLKKIF